MPVCDDATIKANGEAADPRVYHGVRVLITASDATSITFVASRVDGTTGTFTAIWGDIAVMWAPCPSTLPSRANLISAGPPLVIDAGTPPLANVSGELYLAEAFVTANNLAVTTPKWPTHLDIVKYESISVWPTSVILTGIELVTGNHFAASVNLLDRQSAQPGQTLVLGNDPVQLRLGPTPLGDFGIALLAAQTPWPWRALTDAVTEIEGIASDPHKLARAWTVIAACIEQFAADDKAGLVTAQHVAELRRVLPQHPALQ
jgi:hypothetical protein